MKNSISKVERRLVKVEQKLAERARRKLLETCVCTKVSYFESVEPEKLEKEMNVPCPAHEFRSLGSRFSVLVQPNGPEPRPASLVGRPQPRVDYAFFHANPNKAAELGRIGGRKKSRPPADVSDPLPKLDKVTAVRDAVEKLIADVLAGKLHPRVAASLAPLFSLQLRAVEAIGTMEAMDLKGRLEKVEELMARLQAEDDREVPRKSARSVIAEGPLPELEAKQSH